MALYNVTWWWSDWWFMTFTTIQHCEFLQCDSNLFFILHPPSPELDINKITEGGCAIYQGQLLCFGCSSTKLSILLAYYSLCALKCCINLGLTGLGFFLRTACTEMKIIPVFSCDMMSQFPYWWAENILLCRENVNALMLTVGVASSSFHFHTSGSRI